MKRRTGIWWLSESVGGGCETTRKTGVLTVRYIGWWNCPGHRQNTIVLEMYEKVDLLPNPSGR